jgi:hypothetical protein
VKTFREIVGEAIGRASMAWSTPPAGVFESDLASKLIDEVVEAHEFIVKMERIERPATPAAPMRRTERGFAVYEEFSDTKGQEVRVQLSSVATDRCVWIFCKDREGRDAIEHLGRLQGMSPHLNAEQARKVAAALIAFADGAE